MDLKHLQHYLGVAIVAAVSAIVIYFFVLAPLWKHETEIAVLHGNEVKVVAQTTPAPGVEAALGRLADAVKEKTLSDALAGRIADVSLAQSTIASTISTATGANARLSNALASGLTQGTPKVQVVTVSTKPLAPTSAATPGPSDDNIKADLKDVLNDPTTQVHVDTTVKISYEDKPFSPIFAAYTGSASGIGYTIRRTKALDLDALLLKSSSGALSPGVGIEHEIHGTAAGIGLNVSFDPKTRQARPGAFVSVHF